MSKEDLWTVVGRAKSDLAFSAEATQNFERAISNAGYQLDQNELAFARTQIQSPPPMPYAPGMPPGQTDPEDMALQREMRRKTAMRVLDLWQSVTDSVKATLKSAASTYRAVTMMNMLMFGAGLALFILAAIYGAVSGKLLYSAVFCGLGAGSFVSLFLSGAIDKTQCAISNLVQIDIAFSSYLEQVTFWEAYAQRPKVPPPFGMPPLPELENIEKASAGLQQAALETIQLLQDYVETSSPKKGR